MCEMYIDTKNIMNERTAMLLKQLIFAYGRAVDFHRFRDKNIRLMKRVSAADLSSEVDDDESD